MINKTIEELYRIFHLLEKNIFKYDIEEPIILIQSPKRKNILGTCSVNKNWENKNSEDDKKYEITISAQSLNRPTEEIVETLLHEMVHLHCSLQNIKDTSNNYTYHNKNYKEQAELFGLEVEKRQTVGWAYTKLKESTRELIKTFCINERVFNYYKKPYVQIANTKVIYKKYICPNCNVKFSHYKDLNIKCGVCDEQFKVED